MTPDNPDNKIRVRWLRSHSKYAYSAGNVCFLSADQVKALLEEPLAPVPLQLGEPTSNRDPYVEALPDDWIETPVKTDEVSESSYVSVRFIKAHPAFSYNGGDSGRVTPKNYKLLLEGGFIEPVKPAESQNKNLFGRLNDLLLNDL